MLRLLRLAPFALLPSTAAAQLTVDFMFNPSQTGGTCSIAVADDLWFYSCFGSTFDRYAKDGTFLGSIPRPGGSANDADLDVVSQAMTLGGVPVPAGTLLYFDGEVGVCEVYAVDPATGVVLSSLVTAFGSNHTVGGAYDAIRDELVLLQDSGGGSFANTVARVDPDSGQILSSFSTIAQGFNVGYGDVEASGLTGFLYTVSSSESELGIFDGGGSLLGTQALPTGVSSLSGIGLDDATGETWVCSNGGNVWLLGGLVEIGTPYCAPAVPNSTGSPALTRAFGSEERALNRVRLIAFQLPSNSFGYFLTSQGQAFIPTPGATQGNLCLASPIGRYNAAPQIFNSLTVGRASLDLDLGQTPTPATGLVSVQSGETWNFQAWYRDANPTTTSNFTDAVSVTFN